MEKGGNITPEPSKLKYIKVHRLLRNVCKAWVYEELLRIYIEEMNDRAGLPDFAILCFLPAVSFLACRQLLKQLFSGSVWKEGRFGVFFLSNIADNITNSKSTVTLGDCRMSWHSAGDFNKAAYIKITSEFRKKLTVHSMAFYRILCSSSCWAPYRKLYIGSNLCAIPIMIYIWFWTNKTAITESWRKQ